MSPCGLAQDVADTANRVDEARLAGRLGLPAQIADVDVQRVRHHPEVEAPDLAEDERALQDAVRIAQEELEQVELDRRQLDRPPRAPDLPGVRIEREVGETEDARTCELARPPGSAQVADVAPERKIGRASW